MTTFSEIATNPVVENLDQAPVLMMYSLSHRVLKSPDIPYTAGGSLAMLRHVMVQPNTCSYYAIGAFYNGPKNNYYHKTGYSGRNNNQYFELLYLSYVLLGFAYSRRIYFHKFPFILSW